MHLHETAEPLSRMAPVSAEISIAAANVHCLVDETSYF